MMPLTPVRHSWSKRDAGRDQWFNADKGLGFIEQDSGSDLFVH
jgi:hypothetical protein